MKIVSWNIAHRIEPWSRLLDMDADVALLGEDGSAYWAGRYATVFTRLAALGLSFVGPQAPQGRQADPWPAELPSDSRNVPTFHSSYQTPATATRQLDYVFTSESMADAVRVRARNEVEQWGTSDHCRLEIEVP